MGKKQGISSKGKKGNVFKVAGAASLKAKAKAKPVTVNLKKINEVVRKNVTAIDEQLVHLQKDIISKKPAKEPRKSKPVKSAAPVTEEEKSDTLKKLEDMQF